MSRWTCKWFFLSVILLALVVGGCGGNGGNGNQMTGNMDDDDTPTMECPAGQTGIYPNCMTPPPPAPAGGHNAVINGIVNPETAGDPSMPGPTTKNNRPGKLTDNSEVFKVEPGSLGGKPKTTIGTGANGANADELNLDELDKDDMTAGAAPKSYEGQFMNQNMDSMLGGFAGSVHEKMTGEGDDKVVDTINVFTNMDAAKSARYDEYYPSDGRTADGVTSADTARGILTFATGQDTGKLDLFSGSKIPTGANQSFSIPGADVGGTDVKENEFMGTFNGVAGTYTCGGSACTAVTDGMGKLTLGGGTLTFTPTEKDPMKIMLPGVSYDPDYLSFGYWVRTTGEGDDTKYGVGTFFDGSQPITAVTLEGEATYSGKAAGMYGRKTLNQYGLVVSGSETSGHFTADANLTARFGGPDVAENKQNKIEGTVTNFMDGGEMISPNWELKLNAATISADATGTFNKETVGGGTEGNWIGQFYGPDTTTTDESERYPGGVAGEFTGHFTNGHVIGAFGATKDKE